MGRYGASGKASKVRIRDASYRGRVSCKVKPPLRTPVCSQSLLANVLKEAVTYKLHYEPLVDSKSEQILETYRKVWRNKKNRA